MIPYADPSYFLLLLYPLVVLVGLGLAGRLGRTAVLATSVAVVVFQYGNPLGDAAAGLRTLAIVGLYVAGSIAVVQAYAARRLRHPQTRAFPVAIGLALIPLVVTKGAPLLQRAFDASGALAAGAPPAGAGLPRGFVDSLGFLGMSYMTLRVIDVLIVVHDGVVTTVPRAADLASYLLFVPTISAGPIDRFRHFTSGLEALPRSRREYVRDIETGIHRIAQGLLYKFIIATMIDTHLLTPLTTAPGVLATIGYMYAYSLYLFFDFAGYSAFAIGVGHFFGMTVPENFRAPFLARNFREIWDRWHITLSWWLRDHVYMRFMLTAARRRWFRGNRVRAHHVALLLTMALMGCWHGLAPQYLIYGLYQGGMLVLYDVVERWGARRGIGAQSRLAHVGLVLLTANLFCFGLLIFSGRLFAMPAP